MSNTDSLNDNQPVVPGEDGHDERGKLQVVAAEPIDATASKAKDAALPPVLQTWKTSPLFTALGLIASVVLSYFYVAVVQISYLIIAGGEQSIIPIYVAAILGNAVLAIYLLAIFPSYLTDKPILRSSKVISFMNCAFGGGILGLLWNHNLTKKWGKKSISHLVFGGLSLVCIVVLLIGIAFFSVRPQASDVSQSSASATQQVQQSYTNEASGMTFELPLGWESQEGNDSGYYLMFWPDDEELYSGQSVSIAAEYAASPSVIDFDDATAEGLISDVYLDECSITSSEQKQMGEIDYYAATATGKDEGAPVRVDLRAFANKRADSTDLFIYFDYTDSHDYDCYHDDFANAMLSVSYE